MQSERCGGMPELPGLMATGRIVLTDDENDANVDLAKRD